VTAAAAGTCRTRRGQAPRWTSAPLADGPDHGYCRSFLADAPGPAVDGALTLTWPGTRTALHMADSNPTVVATPYPTYIQGGDDGESDAFKAALIVQGDASTQRNQDAQFASLQSQLVHRDVQGGKRETAQAKYDLAVQGKDAEVRTADRFSEVAKSLAELNAKLDAQTIAQLRVDLAETKAEGRQAQTDAMLAAIAKKIGL
jgi:hypothetical protein